MSDKLENGNSKKLTTDDSPPEPKEFATPSGAQNEENYDVPTTTKTTQMETTESVEPDASQNKTLEECTVKEILNEILDCKVLRTLATPNAVPLANRDEEASNDLPESSFQYSARSKMVSVKEILGEILDCTVFKKGTSAPTPFVQHERNTTGECFAAGPSTSGSPNVLVDCRSELEVRQTDYQVFRAGLGVINSSDNMHSESFIRRPPFAKSISRILPSYSAVLRLGPKASRKSVESFIPRLPPPSYAEVEGIWDDSPSLISSDSVFLGPDPVYTVCPGCRTVVVTEVARERSNLTHLVALILCLLFCWPCCLLPYCLKSCNYSYHTCPNCRHYFGVYNPF